MPNWVKSEHSLYQVSGDLLNRYHHDQRILQWRFSQTKLIWRPHQDSTLLSGQGHEHLIYMNSCSKLWFSNGPGMPRKSFQIMDLKQFKMPSQKWIQRKDIPLMPPVYYIVWICSSLSPIRLPTPTSASWLLSWWSTKLSPSWSSAFSSAITGAHGHAKLKNCMQIWLSKLLHHQQWPSNRSEDHQGSSPNIKTSQRRGGILEAIFH